MSWAFRELGRIGAAFGPATSRRAMVLYAAWLATIGFNIWLAATTAAQPGQFDRSEINPTEEALVFTPSGCDSEGRVASPPTTGAARLQVRIVDRATGRPTFCRVNVVGSDGNFYYPPADRLAPYRLSGAWPNDGSGNRQGKAPIRYFGRFFYSPGEFTVEVPPGPTRIEAWKGLEYLPVAATVEARPPTSGDAPPPLELTLAAEAEITSAGYYSGDPHLHFPRRAGDDDELIFDLLEAEDVRYGHILCYNDDTNRYQGRVELQASPQQLGLGIDSVRRRGRYQLISAQEYRSSHYGHLNLYLRPEMVLPGGDLDPGTWPVFGEVARETRGLGGYSVHAHGGYAQEIMADAVLGATDAVELLQFGIYRGIGLSGWYHLLNAGFRFPAVGASDYPACRKLADCVTYVHHPTPPTPAEWLAGMARGRSFVTTGPLLVLEVNGRPPGSILRSAADERPRVAVRMRLRSEVAPVTRWQLVVGGQVHQEWTLEPGAAAGGWLERTVEVELERSTWIAARAFSVSTTNNADAESHTNPVYCYLGDRAPYRAESIDWLLARLDEQLAALRAREFTAHERALAYFDQARQKLAALRAAEGQPAPPDEPGAAVAQGSP